MAVYGEMQGCRIGVSPGSHGLIELDDYAGIEELARSHEGLQRVPLHKPHRVSKLRKGGKIRNVIEILVMQVLDIIV